MRARVPQDVDLEDKLVYGLSPLRFGYLVIAALGILSLWRLEAVPAGLRLPPCLLIAVVAGLMAWGRWRARPLDGWLVDLVVFVRRNYRLRPAWRSPPQRRRTIVPLGAINALGGQIRGDAAEALDLTRVA